MVDKQTGLIVAGVLVFIVGAGAVSAFAGIGPFSADEQPESVFDGIPENANTVFYADPIGFSEDPTTEDVANHYLELIGQDTTYEQSREEYKDELDTQLEQVSNDFEFDADISVDDVGDSAYFGEIEESEDVDNALEEYSGVVFELDITEEEFDDIVNTVADDVESQQELQEDETVDVIEYNGHTMLIVEDEDESFALAILEEGTYVAGTTEAVEDSIDAWNGDVERIDSSLVPESDAENTYFGLGAEVDEELQEELNEEFESNPNIETMTATYATDGNEEVYLDIQLTTSTEEAAQSFVDELQEFDDEAEFELQNLDINAQDTSVTVRYEATTDDINELLDELFGQQQLAVSEQP